MERGNIINCLYGNCWHAVAVAVANLQYDYCFLAKVTFVLLISLDIIFLQNLANCYRLISISVMRLSLLYSNTEKYGNSDCGMAKKN